MPTRLATGLSTWYAEHRRTLPWRNTRDAYAIWVSEVMLQQTQVEAVVPYYRRWMSRFPTLGRLARADEQEVLGLWEGLGYYRRARQLHRTARLIAADHGGRLPRSVEALRGLPGIGPYTASAIAAFAYGQDEVALDGNLRRVISRLADVDVDPRSPAGEARVLRWARRHLPSGRASEFNQALMDLSAAICQARRPRCGECPLWRFCLARRRGRQTQRPVRSGRRPPPHRMATAGVLRRGARVLIGRRPADRLLGGLWEFPGGKCRARESAGACLRRELREELGVDVRVGASLGVYRHAYTHFRVTVEAFECRLERGQPRPVEHTALRWVYPSRLGDYPMGKVARRIADVVAGAASPPTRRGRAGPRGRQDAPSFR
jgi:A/G-specific adenine glycosylase